MIKYQIPQHLDTPPKLILWTIDEILAIAAPFLIMTFCFDSMLLGLVIGGIGFIGLRRLKGEAGHYFLHHAAYWYLPRIFMFKKIPPSHVRRWVG